MLLIIHVIVNRRASKGLRGPADALFFCVFILRGWTWSKGQTFWFVWQTILKQSWEINRLVAFGIVFHHSLCISIFSFSTVINILSLRQNPVACTHAPVSCTLVNYSVYVVPVLSISFSMYLIKFHKNWGKPQNHTQIISIPLKKDI